MNNNHNDLSALWQAQPVKTIDVEEVKRTFFAERKKQRLFMVLDFLGVVPPMVLIWWKWSTFSLVAGGMILAMLLLCLPILFYQLWLRRVTAFGGDLQTRGYLESLIKQMKNNARIAWMTKHSCWVAIGFLLIFNVVLYLQGELTSSEQMVKSTVFLGISAVVLVFVYRWASRRQQLALSRLERFEAMQQ